MNLIIHSTDNPSHALINNLGGKAAALAQLSNTTIQIPPWFVLTPQAFALSLSPEQKRVLEAGTPLGELQLALLVETALTQALDQLCPTGQPVAVRSSALDEDGTQHSFAGQLESYLWVQRADVVAKVLAVWASAFSPTLIAYRREHGLSLMADAPAVLIQHMVDATQAGVAFSADPITGRRSVAVVSAVHGTADQLVTGQVNGETFKIDRAGVVVEHQATSDGVILNVTEAAEVAQLARRCQQHFGCPQDVEWARAEGTLYLLQSRPITTLAQLPDPDGVYALWDNSNIAESYPGVTTPLTFSFARRAYSEVYRQLCRVLGVSNELIDRNSATFEQMVGLINGRIYYNLMSWYRTLALLPGYKINRAFMENMMGVSKRLPDHLLDDDESANPSWIEKGRELFRAGRAIGGLFINFMRLPSKIERFHRRLDVALSQDELTLEEMRLDELVQHYRSLDQQLLTRWDAPLINDFFVMIFYGLLGKLCQEWCDDEAGALQNRLLTDIGDIISTEPAKRMMEMAHAARKHPSLVAALQQGTPSEIAQQMTPDFAILYKRYLAQFGDRCMEELKLESATLHDDPLPLLRSVGAMQARLSNGSQRADSGLYQAAMGQAKSALAGHPIRSLLFNWVLGHARDLVKNRENLRFERTRLFGRVRTIFQNIGRRFVAEGVLVEVDDIFFLNVDEILHFIEGTATCTHLSELAQVRKGEFSGYRALDRSKGANRFETFGAVHVGNRFSADGSATTDDRVPEGDQQLATGCSPGVVRGPVRVIQEPRGHTIQPGEILVAERTDPGWITLFAVAAGLIVEHGSLLSHSAIVSREMGLPSVVALPQATQWLADGDWVELDGATGRVTKLKEAVVRRD